MKSDVKLFFCGYVLFADALLLTSVFQTLMITHNFIFGCFNFTFIYEINNDADDRRVPNSLKRLKYILVGMTSTYYINQIHVSDENHVQ